MGGAGACDVGAGAGAVGAAVGVVDGFGVIGAAVGVCGRLGEAVGRAVGPEVGTCTARLWGLLTALRLVETVPQRESLKGGAGTHRAPART